MFALPLFLCLFFNFVWVSLSFSLVLFSLFLLSLFFSLLLSSLSSSLSSLFIPLHHHLSLSLHLCQARSISTAARHVLQCFPLTLLPLQSLVSPLPSLLGPTYLEQLQQEENPSYGYYYNHSLVKLYSTTPPPNHCYRRPAAAATTIKLPPSLTSSSTKHQK